MILVDIISMILRLAELVFGAIVLGITSHYLHLSKGVSAWHLGRFIYTDVVAGLSVLLAIIWLFPFSKSFIHWPADFIISIAWFVSFGLLVRWLNGSCGYVFNWSGAGFNGGCSEWKADLAFTFISALCWLASALLGLYWVRKHTRTDRTHHAPADGTYHRRRWYRSSHRSRV